MPYRALEAISSDTNPLAEPFTGQLVAEGQGNFVVVGKGGILSDADAEKFGLSGDSRVEAIEDGQALRDSEARNQATYEAGFRAQPEPQPSDVAATSDTAVQPVDNVIEPDNVIEVANPITATEVTATESSGAVTVTADEPAVTKTEVKSESQVKAAPKSTPARKRK